MRNKSKIKTFKVSELELVTCRQALNTWSAARLFYGVPRWAKWVMKDIAFGGLIFSNKPL
jgi:hypothetical protein